jgi:phospholipid/cholesterol/gamma-HCH transport system ATP-binding protein
LATVLAFEGAQFAVAGGPREVMALDGAVESAELVLVDAHDERHAAALAEIALGLAVPSSGTVRFLGQDWRGLPPDYAAALRGRIGWAPDDDAWLPHLPVIENIFLLQLHHTRIDPVTLRDQARALAVRFGLPGLPTGLPMALAPLDRARAAFTRCFLGAPRLILVGYPRRIPRELIPAVINAVCDAREHDAAILWFTGPQDAHIGASIPAARRLNAIVEDIESAHERRQVQVR